MKTKNEAANDKETAKRRDEALTRALFTPPKPHEPIKKKSIKARLLS